MVQIGLLVSEILVEQVPGTQGNPPVVLGQAIAKLEIGGPESI
jgi:hypothetical protein